MWTKDDYQEHMLGYLGAVQIEIEQLAYHAQRQQRDLNAIYADLDATSTWLWRLIEANDEEWEFCRYALEASCDRLLRTFDYVPFADALLASAHSTTRENHKQSSKILQPAVML